MRRFMTTTLVAGLLGLAMIRPAISPAQSDGPALQPALAAGATDGTEVQARGQIHEAYGEPSRSQALEGAFVDRQPPQAIEESPPEDKPAGDNVSWISGYWGWDDEAKDYIWISGFWRVMPPSRSWVPGSWQKAAAGYRWVSGYWGAVAVESQPTEYLPPPPLSIDAGPSIPAPEVSSVYVPGTWVYRTSRYNWRPGYWIGYRPSWVWVPASYRWTPCGYLFVAGYWDRPLLERGLLFAPVRFTRPIYLEAGFVYRPAFVIQPDFLCGALFVRLDGGYYFGDYFTVGYQRRYTAWMSYRPSRFVIDANFGYYRSAYAGNVVWERNLRTLYTSRYSGDIPRPPRTLVQQNTVINNITINKTTTNIVHKNVNITNVQNQTVLSPVKSVSNLRVTGMASLAGPNATGLPAVREMKMERASKERLADETKSIKRNQAISTQRAANETRLTAKAPTATATAPLKVQMELPRGTPAARIIRPTTAVPAAPAGEVRTITTTPKLPGTTPAVTTPKLPITTPIVPTPKPTPKVPLDTPKPMPKVIPAPVPTPKYTPTPVPTPKYTPAPAPVPKAVPTLVPTPKPVPVPKTSVSVPGPTPTPVTVTTTKPVKPADRKPGDPK